MNEASMLNRTGNDVQSNVMADMEMATPSPEQPFGLTLVARRARRALQITESDPMTEQGALHVRAA